MRTRGALLGMMTLASAGCVTTVPPNAEGVRSQQAVRQAEQVAAGRPRSGEYLVAAQRQLAEGRSLVERGQYDRAKYVFLRAEADARLAVAVARDEDSRSEAEQLTAQLQAAQLQNR